jgi:hypothetical protein
MIMKLDMASACFSVKSMRSGANHNAQGKPMDKIAPTSFRAECKDIAGAAASSCFVAPTKSSLLVVALADYKD